MHGVPVSRGTAEGLPDGVRRPGKPLRLEELGLDRLGEPAVPDSLPKDAGPGSLPREEDGEVVRAPGTPASHRLGERHGVFRRAVTDDATGPVGADGVPEDAVLAPHPVRERVGHGTRQDGHVRETHGTVRKVPEIDGGRFGVRLAGSESGGEDRPGPLPASDEMNEPLDSLLVLDDPGSREQPPAVVGKSRGTGEPAHDAGYPQRRVPLVQAATRSKEHGAERGRRARAEEDHDGLPGGQSGERARFERNPEVAARSRFPLDGPYDGA